MKKSDSILLNISIILLILNNMFQNSLYIQIPSMLETGIELFCYVCFATLIIKYLRIEKWKIIILFFIIILACYTGYITKNLTILSSIMFLTITAITKDKFVIKLANKVIICVLLGHIIVYFIQIFIGSASVAPDVSGRTRYLLGFNSPNTSGIFFLWWITGKVYLSNFNMKKVWMYVILTFVVFYFNRCRSMMYSVIILLILSICINKKIGIRIISFLAKNIIIIITITMIILVNLYNMGFEPVYNLDKMLSRRIFFSAEAINGNGYTLAGQELNDTIVTTTTYKGDIIMDVTYIALCYHYGIIYIILLVLLSRYITKTYSEKEYSLLIIYGVFALLEIYSLNFVTCFPMLFGASWIGEKNDT